jgi:hypothetical protein
MGQCSGKSDRGHLDDEALLRALLESGASKTLVAVKLKRTVSAIEARTSIIGVSLTQIKLRLKAKRNQTFVA